MTLVSYITDSLMGFYANNTNGITRPSFPARRFQPAAFETNKNG